MSNLRLIAAQIISDVFKGQSLSQLLTVDFDKSQQLSSRDTAFVKMLCYGVCRFYPQLSLILQKLLTKPLSHRDEEIRALLLVGLFQLMHTRVPIHAVLFETVNAAGMSKKPWAKSLTNAILRNYLRKKEVFNHEVTANLAAQFSHPQWMIDAIKTDWQEQWENILIANNTQPPMSLRVNQLQTTREDYLKECDGQAISATVSGVTLQTPVAIAELPGFKQGKVTVQDGAAQLAAELLQLAPGLRVLDACAAPGGKLTHILEMEPKLSYCLAIDKDPLRVKSIQENLARLNLHADCLTKDAALLKDDWQGKQLFDRILCDAPCSGIGVIRRHPDIKILRKLADISAYGKQQLRLLKALWPLLNKDGILLYVTCSILRKENEKVMQAFMNSHLDAVEETIAMDFAIPCAIGRQLLPGNAHNLDGFYYARLRKR